MSGAHARTGALLLVLTLLAAPRPAAGTTLTFDAPVILGETEAVGVTLALDVIVPEDVPLEVAASAGRFTDVTVAGPRALRAIYHPPSTPYPRPCLVVVAARRPEGLRAVAVARFDLLGRTRIPVSTRPSSEVRVTVGDVIFGPVVAPASGQVEIAIVAPAEIRVARVRALDVTGAETEREVALEVPWWNRLVALSGERRVGPEGRGNVPVDVWVLDPSEDAAAGLRVDAAGTHEVVPQADAGHYRLDWRPGEGPGGPVEATIHLEGDPGSTARVEVQRLEPIDALPPPLTLVPGEGRGIYAGVRIGVAHSLGDQAGARGGLDARIRLRGWRLPLDAGLALEVSQAAQEIPGAPGGRATALVVPLTLRLSTPLLRQGRVVLSAGLGGVLAFAHVENELSGEARDALGAGGLAFVESRLPLGEIELFAETGLGLAPVWAETFRLQAGGLYLQAGVRLRVR